MEFNVQKVIEKVERDSGFRALSNDEIRQKLTDGEERRWWDKFVKLSETDNPNWLKTPHAMALRSLANTRHMANNNIAERLRIQDILANVERFYEAERDAVKFGRANNDAAWFVDRLGIMLGRLPVEKEGGPTC